MRPLESATSLAVSSVSPSRVFVPLAEALSWIAFKTWSDRKGIQDRVANDTVSQGQLEQAVRQFCDLASDGRMRVRGRYVRRFHDNEEAALADTLDIPPNRFNDFQQFDLREDGLRRAPLNGHTVNWEGQSAYEREFATFNEDTEAPGPLSDGYRKVEVRREDVLREFGVPTSPQVSVPQTQVVAWCRQIMRQGVGNMNDAWEKFRDVPEFRGLSRDDVLRPAWTDAKTKS